MARIKERAGRYTCEVRYKDVAIGQTFHSRTEAARWGKAVEVAIDSRQWPRKDLIPPHLWGKWGLAEEGPAQVDDSKPHVGWSLARALEYYAETVTVNKKGWVQEGVRIRWWRRQAVAQKRLDAITPEDFQAHVGRRLAEGRANNTVRNELFLISGLYELARDRPTKGGWGLAGLENPVLHVALPEMPPPRKRRLEDAEDDHSKGEEARLLAALRDGPDGEVMVPVCILALDTGMRQSELLDIRLGQVRNTRSGRYIERPDSKNGHPRRVVLTTRAAKTLDELIAKLPANAQEDHKLFRLDAVQVDYRWRLARNRAGVKGLRFHDLRHEGLSRMAEKGLNLGELREQSGHRTAQVLLTYVNARVSEVAKKLG
jgi:integrase